jgi:peptide/nickel transport system substrate-binding protein
MQLSSIQWMRQTNSKKFNQKFFKLKYFLPQYSYIGWNARKPYFQDRRVRLALTHLINREKIMEKLSFGLGKVVNGTFYILSKSYNNEFPPWPYDPAKGKLLLKQAGWIQSQKDGFLYKDGKKFTFVFSISSGSDTAEKLATILKEDFSKVGIDMLINKFEWAVFVQNLHKRDFEAVMLAWSLGYNDDPYQLWHSSQIPQGSNYCSFNSPESDRLIETARKEFDAEKRYKLYRRMGVILHEEQPYTFMFTNPALVVVSRRFENVKVHTAGLEYLEWKVKKHK